MATFLQRKKFTTSTPTQTLPTSSSQEVETPSGVDSVCYKTPPLVTTTGKNDQLSSCPLEEGTKKGEKQGLTDEDWAQMDKIMEKHFGKSLDKKLDINEDQPDETLEDDCDNLEDAKKWTIRQKLSFTNRK